MADLKTEVHNSNELFQKLAELADQEPFKSMDRKVRAGTYARAFAFQAILAGLDDEEQVQLLREARDDLVRALDKLSVTIELGEKG